VHSETREVETDGGGEKAVDRRRQVRLIAIAVVVILLGWFAVANTRKVQIDFWVFHRQAPLILVILISGLLGALIALLIMRRKPKAEEERPVRQTPVRRIGGAASAARPGSGATLQVDDRVPSPAIGF
jgi:uncharacterized integral membrane protein